MSSILISTDDFTDLEVSLTSFSMAKKLTPLRYYHLNSDLLFEFVEEELINWTGQVFPPPDTRRIKVNATELKKYWRTYLSGTKLIIDPVIVSRSTKDRGFVVKCTYCESINELSCKSIPLSGLNSDLPIQTVNVVYTIGRRWDEALARVSMYFTKFTHLIITIRLPDKPTRNEVVSCPSTDDLFNVHIASILREVPPTVTRIDLDLEIPNVIAKVYLRDVIGLPNVTELNVRPSGGFYCLRGEKGDLSLGVRLGERRRPLVKSVKSKS